MRRVFMSPKNGQLVEALPLFRIADNSEFISDKNSYSIQMFINDPLAYVISADKFMTPQVLSAQWCNKYLIDLGEL